MAIAKFNLEEYKARKIQLQKIRDKNESLVFQIPRSNRIASLFLSLSVVLFDELSTRPAALPEVADK